MAWGCCSLANAPRNSLIPLWHSVVLSWRCGSRTHPIKVSLGRHCLIQSQGLHRFCHLCGQVKD